MDNRQPLKTLEKGEIAHNEQFLLFPQCFLLNQIIVSPFVHIFDIISLFAAELEDPKIGILVSGKGLNREIMILAIFVLGHVQNFKLYHLVKGPKSLDLYCGL